MRLGIFADTHDHLDHLRLAVEHFNRAACDYVAFAGDFVSTFAIPPLRRLKCPLIAVYGDNEGNKVGIAGGMQIIGTVGEPPLGFRLGDGTRILLTHQRELFRDEVDGADIIIYAHTHKPRAVTDEAGRLWINPGETSGWTYRRPTIAILETTSRHVSWIELAAERDREESASCG